MKKILLLFTVITMVSCTNREPAPVANLIANPSFEDANGFSLQDWTGHITSSSNDAPANGGNYSLVLKPGWAPDEGFAETSISNLQGAVSLDFSCDVKTIDWTGKIIIFKEDVNGNRSEITRVSFNNAQWENISLEINTVLNNDDLLIIHLSAGITELPTGKVLFDNVMLTD